MLLVSPDMQCQKQTSVLASTVLHSEIRLLFANFSSLKTAITQLSSEFSLRICKKCFSGTIRTIHVRDFIDNIISCFKSVHCIFLLLPSATQVKLPFLQKEAKFSADILFNIAVSIVPPPQLHYMQTSLRCQ